ncbi:DUF3309 family protein [Legionella cardiaca]
MNKKDSIFLLFLKGFIMSLLGLILLIIILLAVLPTWPYSSGWGYYPSGIVGLILIILIIMLLTRGGL